MFNTKDIAHNNRLLRYETDQLTEHQLCSQELCSQGIKVPIYCFGTQSLMDNCPFGGFSQTSEEEQSLLDSLLLARWEDRMWRGHFKYDITTTEIKVICGEKKFLAQLNGAWSMNCTGEAGDCKMTDQGYLSVIDWMKQYEELLFCISSGEKAYSELIFSAAVPNYSLWIIITVNPIEYGHVFLVPHGFNSLYQVLDARTLEMVARVAVETNNSSFGIFYDFSGPNASNLYFQACYLPGILPVESLPVDTLFADRQGEICISTVRDYPIKTLLFESRTNFKMMLEVVAEICSSLLDKVIPYNMLISDCGKKIFLFLQCPRLQALSNSCNLSAWECGGYFLFSSRQEFDQVMEEDLLKLLNSVSLDNEGFAAVKQLCCNIPNGLVI